ncbi:MAG: gliding motility-associated C-terminal domain-containing protein [Opitutaceae bacterium]|nr:gliding motility-associated C-terminal domain-containing protein [Cytophagales bacterium]
MSSNLNTLSFSIGNYGVLMQRLIFLFWFCLVLFNTNAQTQAIIISPKSSPFPESSRKLVCNDTITLQGNSPQSNEKGRWYLEDPNKGIFLKSDTSPTTLIKLTQLGIVNVYWTIYNPNDPTSTLPATVYLNNQSPDSAIIPKTSDSTCNNFILLDANKPIKGSGKWSSKLNPFISFADSGSNNTQAKNLPKGNSILFWEITTGTACPIKKDSIFVKNISLTNSVAGKNDTTCNDIIYLKANPTDSTDPNEVGKWTANPQLPNGPFISNSNSNYTLVTNLQKGINSFSWTISNPTKECGSNKSSVTVLFNKPSTATISTKSDSTCSNQFKLNAVPASGGKWSVILGKGSGTFSKVDSATTTVSGLSPGVNSFKWTVLNPGCKTSVDSVQIFYKYESTPIVDKEFCTIFSPNTLLKLQLKNKIPESGTWFKFDLKLNIFNNDTANTATFIPPLPGVYIFSFQLNGSCKQPAVFTKYIVLTKAFLPSDRCISTTNNTFVTDSIIPLISPSANEGKGTWSLEASTPVLNNPNLIVYPGGKLKFLNFPPGVYKFKWSVSDSLCIDCKTKCPNSAFITVTIYNKATIKKPVSTCTNDSIFGLSANKLSSLEKGTWSSKTGSFFPGNTSETVLLKNLAIGKDSIYWNVKHAGGCLSRDSIVIFRLTEPNAGKDTCFPSNGSNSKTLVGTLKGNAPTNEEQSVWYFTGNGLNDKFKYPDALFSNTKPSEVQVNNTAPGNYILRYVIFRPGCTDIPGDTIKVTFVGKPKAMSDTFFVLPLNKPIKLFGETFANQSISDTTSWDGPTGKTQGGVLTVPNTIKAGLNVYKFEVKNKFNSCSFSENLKVKVVTSPKITGPMCINSSAGFQVSGDPRVLLQEQEVWESSNPNISIVESSQDNVKQIKIDNPAKGFIRRKILIDNIVRASDSLSVTRLTTPIIQLDTTCSVGPTFIVKPKGITLQNYEVAQWIKADTTNKLVRFKNGRKLIDTLLNLNSVQQTIKLVIKGNNCSETSQTSVAIVSVNKAKVSPSLDTCITSNFIKLATVKGLNDRVLWKSNLPLDIITSPNSITTNITLSKRESNIILTLTSNYDPKCFSKDSLVITQVTPAEKFNDTCLKGTNRHLLEIKFTTPYPQERFKWYSLGKNNDTIFKSDKSQVTDSLLVQGENKVFWEISYRSPLTNKVCSSKSTKVIVMVPNAQYKPLDTCYVKTEADKVISVKTLNDTSNVNAFWIKDNLYSSDLIAKKDSLYNFTLKETGIRNYVWKVTSKTLANCSTFTNLKLTVIPKANAGVDTCMKSPKDSINLKGSLINKAKGEKGIWTSFPKSLFTDSSASITKATLTKKGKTGFQWLVSNNNCRDSDSSFATFISKANIRNADSCLYYSNELSLDLKNDSIDNDNNLESGMWMSASDSSRVNKTSNLTAKAILAKGLNNFKWKVFATKNPSCYDIDSVKYATFSTSGFRNIIDTLNTCTKDTSLIISSRFNQDSVYFQLSSGQKLIPNNNKVDLRGLSNDITYSLYRTVRNKIWPKCFLTDTFRIQNRQVDTIILNPNETIVCNASYSIMLPKPKSDILTAKGKLSLIDKPGTNVPIIIPVPDSSTSKLSFPITDINAEGEFIFLWTVKNSICIPRTATFRIERKPSIEKNLIVKEVCGLTDFSFSELTELKIVQGADNVIWLGPNDKLISTVNNKDSIVAKKLAIGDNGYKYIANKNGCQGISEINIKKYEKFVLNESTKIREFDFCERDTLTITANYRLQILDTLKFKVNFSYKENLDSLNKNITKRPINSTSTQAFIKNMNKNFNPGQIIYIKAHNGVCQEQTDSVIINNSKKPIIKSVGKDDSLCTSVINLKGSGTGYQTGIWTAINGDRNLIRITDSTSVAKAIRDSLNIFQWTVKNGACTESARVKHLVGDSISEATILLSHPTYVCDSSVIHLKSKKPNYGNSVWLLNQSVIPNSNVSSNNNLPFSTIGFKDKQKLLFTWKVFNEYCTNTETVSVIFYEAPVVAVAGSSQSLVKDNYILQGNNPGYGKGRWNVIQGGSKIENDSNPNSEVRQLSFGENILKWTISNGTCPVSSDMITITYSDFNIPSGFSPNGDNKNDLFEIRGIESYPGTQLKVFNRWGMLVYSSADYQNQWDGSGLSDDTYYYELKIAGSKEKHGYILLKRK